MLISIIIPCYNEENRIGHTLEAIDAYFKSQKEYDYEMLAIDNGSNDGTVKLIREYQKKIPALQLVQEKSYGKGWAVKEGMLAARGDYRIFTDADNSTDIAQFEKLMKYARSGYDVVVSSRRMKGSHIIHPQPRFRAALGNLFNYLVHVIVPLKVKDTQNGFKLFSREAAEKIFEHQTIFYWAFDVEVLALADKFGFRVKEVPITWVNDEGTHVNIKGMVRMLFEVMLTRLHLMTRDY